jgi:hypothetical protein
VTGHSLGGCTSEVVALELRQLGREKGIESLTRARCMAFAGGPAATPELQQSAESKELTVCVVFGNDIVPRLGAKSVCTLLDELTAHGVLETARRKFKEQTGGGSEAAGEAAGDTISHEYSNFPGWVGLPNGGSCTGCNKKRWKPTDSKYCKFCFVCESCCKKGATNSTEQPCLARVAAADQQAETAAQQQPEPEAAAPIITQLALGGRVLWIDPKFKPTQDASTSPHMRWLEWQDVVKIVASSKMIEHHLARGYLNALEARLEAAQ